MNAIALNDIHAIGWDDGDVIVAKQGDKVKVLQQFKDMVWIQCEGWEFEVVVFPKDIQLID